MIHDLVIITQETTLKMVEPAMFLRVWLIVFFLID